MRRRLVLPAPGGVSRRPWGTRLRTSGGAPAFRVVESRRTGVANTSGCYSSESQAAKARRGRARRAVREATTLTSRKHTDISTCCRTSKPNWRPRVYCTTNPGGVGHQYFRARFVVPYLEKREGDTRFIPARVADNSYNNLEYKRVLEALTGWQRRAWLDGDWDLAAGQFFTTWNRQTHVVADFDSGPRQGVVRGDGLRIHALHSDTSGVQRRRREYVRGGWAPMWRATSCRGRW